LLHEVEGLRTQIGHGGEVDAAWVLEHPGKPLLAFKVDGDRRRAGETAGEGRSVEEELSPVHRHSHRFQDCHQAR
jgi:hypothetical protein